MHRVLYLLNASPVNTAIEVKFNFLAIFIVTLCSVLNLLSAAVNYFAAVI